MKIKENVMERYLYKKHLKGYRWAARYLLDLGIGDRDDSNSPVGEW